ncbi:alpha/beta hydrolase [Devosia sp. WQ 349]|uniref:RBBP9/YdeN family alpha/beta hydrolase n=1 Tax=Devosia sp. WQ 349K1 TaxID=2800329 RepID=UPI0019042809|nr:alpha/beta hydrolase [Devosia sp. WQ 349K1]MBK1794726.1 alpha/beta hydrolase [Devosia sp. WQ 349K1]
MTRPVLIVPGLNGSNDGHWQHYWLRDKPEAVLVEQAEWADPKAGRWLHRLEKAVMTYPGAIVVGHSLGTILAARLATSPVAPLVGGVLLVAPADIERTSTLHARSYEFGALPGDKLPFPGLMVASRDDIYMNLAKARTLAQHWGVPVLDLGHAGHINIASGFGRWARGYDLAQQLADKADRQQRHRRAMGPQSVQRSCLVP